MMSSQVANAALLPLIQTGVLSVDGVKPSPNVTGALRKPAKKGPNSHAISGNPKPVYFPVR